MWSPQIWLVHETVGPWEGPLECMKRVVYKVVISMLPEVLCSEDCKALLNQNIQHAHSTIKHDRVTSDSVMCEYVLIFPFPKNKAKSIQIIFQNN